MAHLTLQAGAPDVAMEPGVKLVLEAISPTTDASITGVTCSRWAIYGFDENDLIDGTLEFLIPELTPDMVEG